MLRSLFARLTPRPKRGTELFAACVAEARRAHWYMQGEVEDTVDGRFAVLATVLALVSVRLEQGHAEARALAAALVERFVDAMDAEHRQMGVGDPSIGKKVRKLVSALANRVNLWRAPAAAGEEFAEAVRASLYRGAPPSEEALAHSSTMLEALWAALAAANDESLAQGRIA